MVRSHTGSFGVFDCCSNLPKQQDYVVLNRGLKDPLHTAEFSGIAALFVIDLVSVLLLFFFLPTGFKLVTANHGKKRNAFVWNGGAVPAGLGLRAASVVTCRTTAITAQPESTAKARAGSL